MEYTEAYAKVLDESDPLKHFKNEFYLNPDRIYMDGNSLGLLSKRAEVSLTDTVASWKEYAIDGWTEGKEPWFTLPERLGELCAPLVGAEAEEVVITGSATVNLHQLTAAFYKPAGKRKKILADELNFPSDIYALKSQLLLKGLDPETELVRVKSRDGRTLDEEDIIAAMTDETALAVLPAVLYRSGQILDMRRLTEAAHERGILIGFDACHSIGAIPHAFHDWGVDFAFWCTYKHLNGGPGSPGGLFVHSRHFGREPGLSGWFGSDKAKQFDMEHEFVQAGNAGAYQIGTPHLLSMAPLLGSFTMIAEAGIDRIRTKSLAATDFLTSLVRQELKDFGFSIGSPAEDHRRGGHIALEHPEGARICRALKEAGVIPDFRAPDIIRLAPVPLYTSFTDIWDTIMILKQIMLDKKYEKFENKRGVVA